MTQLDVIFRKGLPRAKADALCVSVGANDGHPKNSLTIATYDEGTGRATCTVNAGHALRHRLLLLERGDVVAVLPIEDTKKK